MPGQSRRCDRTQSNHLLLPSHDFFFFLCRAARPCNEESNARKIQIIQVKVLVSPNFSRKHENSVMSRERPSFLEAGVP